MVLAPPTQVPSLRYHKAVPPWWERAGDGDNTAGLTGKSAKEIVNPLRREGRVFDQSCGDYGSCCFAFDTSAAGAANAPGLPCALSAV